uniref:Uncharacterized protein n=1 Tax=Oryza sativa subsp. japonica TaxID=39947 RepID=Q6Z5A0_ORYSJ|nr:hypothetical protein [Oryza sativa Japonica Group]
MGGRQQRCDARGGTGLGATGRVARQRRECDGDETAARRRVGARAKGGDATASGARGARATGMRQGRGARGGRRATGRRRGAAAAMATARGGSGREARAAEEGAWLGNLVEHLLRNEQC